MEYLDTSHLIEKKSKVFREDKNKPYYVADYAIILIEKKINKN